MGSKQTKIVLPKSSEGEFEGCKTMFIIKARHDVKGKTVFVEANVYTKTKELPLGHLEIFKARLIGGKRTTLENFVVTECTKIDLC